MANSCPSRKNVPTPESFGGCEKLFRHYQTIGSELLVFEDAQRLFGARNVSAFTNFREGVVFVPVEVLESYLEDLLNPCVTARKLFIQQGEKTARSFLVLLGLLCGVLLIVNWVMLDMPPSGLFVLGAATILPLLLLWWFVPQLRLARRMRFARVLSRVIARRRGQHIDGAGGIGVFSFEDILVGKAASTQGAAREGLSLVP